MKIYQTENKIDKLNDNVFWMIFIFLAGMIFSLFLAEAVIIFIFLAYIFKSIRDKKFYYFKTPLDFAFLAFIFARILSIFFSTDISVSAASLNKEIFFYSSFFLFTYFLNKDDERTFLILFKILILAAIVASMYGTLKVLLGFVERASSTTSGYSTLGMFLAVIFCITLGLGRNKKFFPSRILWFIVLLIIVTGILFTFNRTHWGIVALLSLFIIILRERTFLVFALTLTGIMIFFVPSLSDRFLQLLHFNQHLSDRDVIWKGAYMLMFDHPLLGFGTRTFRNIFPLMDSLTDKGVASWHSDYIQMYFEGGIVSLAAFLWVMVSVFYYGVKTVKDKFTNKFNKDLLFAVLLGISVFYLTALVGGFILDPISTLLFQFLLAVAGIIIAKGFSTE